ncbi:acetate--CoA ligase family protein [Streptomyces roseoverticillatus]|uniref:acetate--CoA ligase family protein n=1 Tax=Streptomyces roseoverticillatus TaxID=66429 RepID=UPI001F28CD7C|nr:acetate--CoA ligase family protein [Streptomyces roseoverticillatus]MCF3103177.1 acetate--CoA ligase family protein [Streptomyces roseoverticillatus]
MAVVGSGRHGGTPVGLAALERLLLSLSRMACDLPQLAEADLNPVAPRPDGVMALDARIRLEPRQDCDAYLRRLR